MVSSVSIRLGTTGKADVQADFASIADSGDASAKRLAASYQRAGQDIEAATKRQADAAAKISAIMPSSTQATVNASVGTGYNGAQNANAAQFTALLAQQEQQVERVKAAIDPLYTSQKRYDAEIAAAGGLLKTGAISEAEHAAAVAVSGRALQEAKNAVEGHTSALGLNRAQVITGQSALLRFTDAVISGRNPLTAFALEAHKGVEVLSMDEGGMAGGLAKVAAFCNPVTIGIAAITAVVAIGAISWIHYADEMAKLDTVAAGAGAAIGATGAQLEANAQAVSRNGVLTVGAARDIEVGYVKMGGIGTGVLQGLTSLTADFAAATGTDAKAAQETLGKAFQDPIKGAEELAGRYGSLTQAQIESLKKTQEENGLYAAQAELLRDLNPAFDGAAKHAEGFARVFDEIKASVSGAWEKLNQFIAGANAATPLAQKLTELQEKRAQAAATPFGGFMVKQLDTQIADTQKAIADQQKANTAAASKFAQGGLDAGSGYTGYDQKKQLEDQRDKIADGLRNGKYAPDELQGQREALEAYTRAINTYLGPAEKKRQLDLADVAVAQARAKRDPAALAAASANRERIEQSGQVATNADVQADAMAKGERARARLDGAADKHAATLARESAAMEANTRAAMDAAQAYLTGGAASGEEAEARRKAVTDATKKGTNVDDAVRRQIANSGADAELAGAKAISSLLQETSARAAVNDQVDKGVISVDDMSRALGDEQALRSLTVAQTLAQKKGLTELYSAITAEIEKYKSALTESHDAEDEGAFLKSLDAVADRIKAARLAGQYAGDTSGDFDRAKSLAATNKQADVGHFTSEQRATNNAQGVIATNEDLDAKRRGSADDAVRASNDNLAITQAQLGMVGKSADAQQLIVDKLKLQQSLAISLGDQYQQYAPAILAAASAADVGAQHLKQAQATMSELQSAGDKFIDDLTNPKGDGIKNLLKDIEQEMLKLAAINPLKNMLLGENNPTLGSLAALKGGSGGGGIGGIFGKLSGFLGLGGGPKVDVASNEAGANSAIASILGSLHGFASGTESAAAGPAWVGEQGPELVNLPQGAKVTNAADTRRLMSAANDPSHIKVSIETNDAMFSAKVSSISGAHVEAAAPGIRSGAVSDVKEHYARQGRYGLGQR
ncbi:phage tail length tape measure family protein [uncultured Sphingomonas sp.]|uniref:phage tail length tape measure family protein n=1 Tax=uncultured Sphingomonas sp. TaxID=158754 RepID=UPI00261EA2FE|nr:phage tail length tape measure family protein [uncultured Sphingomonas sp.]